MDHSTQTPFKLTSFNLVRAKTKSNSMSALSLLRKLAETSLLLPCSVPACLFYVLRSLRVLVLRDAFWKDGGPSPMKALVLGYLLCVSLGLHRMHSQHLYRQLKFTQDVLETQDSQALDETAVKRYA